MKKDYNHIFNGMKIKELTYMYIASLFLVLEHLSMNDTQNTN
jgi:hypothetical protein